MIYNKYFLRAENAIDKYLSCICDIPEPLLSAIRYSVLNGGKRLRPVLVYLGADAAGLRSEEIDMLAVAVEFIHSYSLVHDDMPCMDNDDMRRGKPSRHKAYGEGMALLAGDALLNMAYELLTKAAETNRDFSLASHYISRQAGPAGMIGGQCIDIEPKISLNEDDILEMYSLKTARLIRAAFAGGFIAGGGNGAALRAAEEYAEGLGIAFQIADDFLDLDGNPEEIGKNTGSDEKKEKLTIIKFSGREKAQQIKSDFEKRAYNATAIFDNADDMRALIDMLINRKN